MIRGWPSTISVSFRTPACCPGSAPWPVPCRPALALPRRSAALELRPQLVHVRVRRTRRPGRPCPRTRASPAGSWRPRPARSPRRSLPANPLPRPATSRLAASRLTSHSHGPGRVSSKSLTSKTRRRSAEPKTPKLDRCASPHACTVSPETGVRGQVAGHRQGGPAVEGERRGQHPAVADRHQLRHPGRGLLLQQADRVGPVRRRLELRVALPRHLRPRRLAPGGALGRRQVPEPGVQLVPVDSPRPGLGGHHSHGLAPFPAAASGARSTGQDAPAGRGAAHPRRVNWTAPDRGRRVRRRAGRGRATAAAERPGGPGDGGSRATWWRGRAGGGHRATGHGGWTGARGTAAAWRPRGSWVPGQLRCCSAFLLLSAGWCVRACDASCCHQMQGTLLAVISRP